MRTYLKNWMVIKSSNNLYQLIVTSDWNLVNRMVRIMGVEHVITNEVISESILKFEVVVGTPNPTTVTQIIPLSVKWYELPFDHKVTIKAYEAGNLTDDEFILTSRTAAL